MAATELNDTEKAREGKDNAVERGRIIFEVRPGLTSARIMIVNDLLRY